MAGDAAEPTAAEDRVEELERAVAAFAGREGAIRASLVEAHDRLLERDEEVVRLQLEIERLEHARGEVAEEARRLRLRLERLLASPPMRAYRRAKDLPGVRSLAARRQAGYDAALADTDGT